jgi:hypothetical protein
MMQKGSSIQVAWQLVILFTGKKRSGFCKTTIGRYGRSDSRRDDIQLRNFKVRKRVVKLCVVQVLQYQYIRIF